MRKVFCVGFQKTGTTSLEQALGLLGYRVASVFGRELPLEALRASFVMRGLEIAREVDAVQDMPWPLMFRELDEEFPDARFILTTRDEDAWWRSILGHFGGNPAVLQQLTYGADAGAPLGNEHRYRAVYRAHNDAVRQYFADRPGRLLVLDLSRDAGWNRLAEFLEVTPPSVPFPHANQPRQVPTFRRRLRRSSLVALNALFRLSRSPAG